MSRDQELRFTVHDSPDYYQLKMSIFTDDKKTDLIGEAWIDLKGIIIPGGGQNDVWQGLTCKGKYAGEIRLEITFYDSRPRPERATVARHKNHSVTEKDAPSLPKPRTPVKRRPLPLDPITGEALPNPPIPTEQPRTPQSVIKSASHSALIPSQSPLQSIEYGTPPRGARQPADHPSPSPHSAYRRAHRSLDSHGSPASFASFPDQVHELAEDTGPSAMFNHAATPPPPPIHRSRQNSADPDPVPRSFHDVSPQKSPVPMRQDVLRSEARRHTASAPAYPGQPVFKPYEPPSSMSPRHESPHGSPSSRYQSPSPRCSPSHSPSHSPHQRFMQPTVEDVPDSSAGPYKHSKSRSTTYLDELAFQPHPTAPQSFNRSIGSHSHYTTRSPLHNAAELPDSDSRPSSVSPLSSTDSSSDLPQLPYASQLNREQRLVRHSDYQLSHSARQSPVYVPPPLPPSLSTGVDLALSQEFAPRSYDQSPNGYRYSEQRSASPTRGRHRSEPPFGDDAHNYVPRSHYERSIVTYSRGPDPHASGPKRSPSPNPGPHHQIRRKSVSPAPPPPENRRLSDVPFGPDSYDALNPSLSSSGGALARNERPDPDAKIITHDGREVDPSDHLPMETWAPEPEPKVKQASPEPRGRPLPSGAQPMPPSGRRPLRVMARPVATATQPPLQELPYGQLESMHNAPTGGRTRLQRKLLRASAGHASHASVSSPLAPLSSDNFQDRQAPYGPTRRRGFSFDYPNENFAPYFGTGPPLPAKIPLPIMSGASGEEDVSLVQEMQRIDIGAGRSRRRGGY